MSYLLSNCNGVCRDLSCNERVKLNALNNRYYITMGHAGYNSKDNNRGGYVSKESALLVSTRLNGE